MMIHPTTILVGPIGLGILLLDAVGTGPLSELGPLAQMGVAGLVLCIWWIERKERRDRQVEDDKRYMELQDKLFHALTRPTRCPMVKDDDTKV